jgi:hypothetical protein
MQVRWLLFAAGLLVGSTSFVIQACGKSDDSEATADAGDDGASGDTGAGDSATCDLSQNLLDTIPDAAIADGASSTGICLGCVSANCPKQVASCNALCECKGFAATGLDCYAKNSTNPTVCLAGFALGGVSPSVQTLGIQLLGCVNTNCQKQCATSSYERSDAGDAD